LVELFSRTSVLTIKNYTVEENSSYTVSIVSRKNRIAGLICPL
jgi:hypothetical protein